jgi:hypothetical protein
MKGACITVIACVVPGGHVGRDIYQGHLLCVIQEVNSAYAKVLDQGIRYPVTTWDDSFLWLKFSVISHSPSKRISVQQLEIEHDSFSLSFPLRRIVRLSFISFGNKYPLKAKLSHYMPWRHSVERRYSSYSFLTSTLDEGEWSASRPGRALPPGNGHLIPIEQEAGWAPRPVWTQARGKILLSVPRHDVTNARVRQKVFAMNFFLISCVVCTTHWESSYKHGLSAPLWSSFDLELSIVVS